MRQLRVLRRAAPFLAVALGLTGCFESVEWDPGESGTRLRVIGWEPESGGPTASFGLHDTELGIDCRFLLTPEGEWRCLPAASGGWEHYADPACDEPLLRGRAFCDAEIVTLSVRVSTLACGARRSAGTRGVRRGAPFSGSPIYQWTGEGCREVADPPDDLVEVVPVDDETFVAAELEPAPREGDAQIGRWLMRAEDGTAYPIGWWDYAHETSCGVHPSEADEWPCVPVPQGSTVLGGDSCDQVYAVDRPRDECSFETSGWYVAPRYSDDYCRTERVDVYRRGEPATPTNLAECSPRASEGSYFEVAPADDVGTISGEPIGSGRLRLYPHPPPRTVVPIVYRDTELEVDCAPMRAGDGNTRCLPVDTTRTLRATHFADPACTEPAEWDLDELIRCWGWIVDLGEPDACGASLPRAVYRLGDPIDEVYERDDAGECRPVDIPARALDRVPLERFVRIERVEL